MKKAIDRWATCKAGDETQVANVRALKPFVCRLQEKVPKARTKHFKAIKRESTPRNK